MRRVRSDAAFKQVDLDLEETVGVQSATKHFLLFLLDAYARTVTSEADLRATLEPLCQALLKARVLDSLNFLSDYGRYYRKYLAPCGAFLHGLLKAGAVALTAEVDGSAADRSGGSGGSGACTPRHGLRRGHANASTSSLCLASSRFASEWEDLGPVGRGGYGAVHRARNRLDGALYAVKKIRLRSAHVPERVLREVKALARLSHAHVIRYHTAWLEVLETNLPSPVPSPSPDHDLELHSNMAAFTLAPQGLAHSHTFMPQRFSFLPRVASVEGSLTAAEADGEADPSLVLTPTDADGADGDPAERALATAEVTLYIAMELCECTLQDWLERPGRVVQAAENLALLTQLTRALEYLHGLGIVHRDVKPSNCFLKCSHTGLLTLRLGDFGLARDGSTPPSPATSSTALQEPLPSAVAAPPSPVPLSSSGPHSGRLGTRTYAAPEQESVPPAPYTPAADVYAVGIVLVELYFVFSTRMERSKLLSALRRHELPVAFLARQPREAALASALLHAEPLARPSATEALRVLEECAAVPHVSHPPLLRGFDRNRLASSTPD